MAPNILDENPPADALLRVGALVKLPQFRHAGRGGKPMSFGFIMRAILDGSRGLDGRNHKLPAVRLGGAWCVTLRDFNAWLGALSDRPAPATPTRSASARERQIAAAEKRLASAGI